jgi:hypothetical protein
VCTPHCGTPAFFSSNGWYDFSSTMNAWTIIALGLVNPYGLLVVCCCSVAGSAFLCFPLVSLSLQPFHAALNILKSSSFIYPAPTRQTRNTILHLVQHYTTTEQCTLHLMIRQYQLHSKPMLIPLTIDLFMIGRCDTDTYEWSAHVITVFESDSPPDFVFA